MEQDRESVESWKQNPWKKLPTWGKWLVGIIGALIILTIGAVIGGAEEDTLKDELASAETRLTRAEEERDEAQEERDQAEEEAGRITARKSQILAQAKSEASKITRKLEDQRGELESVEGELSETREELSGAEDEKALSTIPGNGTFKAEVDYLPGTYRSDGGSSCYWATLSSADPFDIASNENASGPTIASINTPYFQTEGCGKWTRIGE